MKDEPRVSLRISLIAKRCNDGEKGKARFDCEGEALINTPNLYCRTRYEIDSSASQGCRKRLVWALQAELVEHIETAPIPIDRNASSSSARAAAIPVLVSDLIA